MHFTTTSALLALAANLLPASLAHEAMWGTGVFEGYGDPSNAYPLNADSGSISKWFFRGRKPSDAKGAVQLKAGSTVTLNIGCDVNALKSGQTCEDPGALHSSNGKRTGCGLAISYKNFEDIKPADLIVFSQLSECVLPTSKHTFKVPSNLPSTLAGKMATCAWGWIPPADSAADEMYMTGFNCEVSSSTPAGSKISNASKLPFLYYAVQGINAPKSRPAWNQEYKDGTQTLVIEAASASNSTESTATPSKAKVNAASKATASSKGKCGSSRLVRRAHSTPPHTKRGVRHAGAPVRMTRRRRLDQPS